MTAPRDVRLVIDRLVLHGVDRADAAAVRRALSGTLEQMLTGSEIDAAGTDPSPRIRLSVPPVTGPASLGREAGRALGRTLLSPGRGPAR